MYTLGEQVELLSDGWLDTVRAFLTTELAGRSAASCSVAVRLSNAPPHLECADNIAVGTLRIEGPSATVTRSFDDGADLTIEGDYQAVLLAAQSVGAEAPGVVDAACEEINHWFGPEALRVRGNVPEPAQRLLASVHDHLARRTVENPDLAHRAAAQGLAGKVREMEEQGYTVIERAIAPAFADEVREATIRALLPHHASQMQWMLYHGVAFEKLVQNPLLMTLIDASLGRGAVVASISSIRRGPGPGSIPMHTDYSNVPEPYPEFAMTGVGVWALEDWRIESGPTWIAPGTHRLRRGPQKGEQRDGVAIEMPKGSVVYFTHGVWHWQGDRSEPGERVTIHSHFNRGILRSLEPKKVDVQMMHRNPPRLGEMLGEDDWFDKLTAQGRDYQRLAHMSRLDRFNMERKVDLLSEVS